MHRQASELKIHEEQNEDDDDLEEEALSHKIKKASPEINKKRQTYMKSPDMHLKEVMNAEVEQIKKEESKGKESKDSKKRKVDEGLEQAKVFESPVKKS